MKSKKATYNLNRHASSALLTPFAKMNSVARLDMSTSAIKHAVVPTDPDYPIVDSAFTNDMLFSTDDRYETSGVKLLDKIEKVINNTLCETSYIYEVLGTGEIKLIQVPTYSNCYKFGYKTVSQFEGMNVGDIKEGKFYTKHYKHFDVENNIVSFGKNINIIYDINSDVAEDAIIITKDLAERFKRPYIDTVEIMVTSDYIMRNLYGSDDEYKPIPLPGDTVIDGMIASMYIDDSKSFIAYNDDSTLDSDSKYMIQFDEGAKVVDIEVYSKDPIRIPIIEQTRLECIKYMSRVVDGIVRVKANYSPDKIHYSLDNLKDKYSLIINGASLATGIVEMKSNTLLKITTVKDQPLQITDKLTGRHGNKGTISNIVDKITVLDENSNGTPVDAIMNLTAVFNRENPAQLYCVGLSTLWGYVQKYLKFSKDDNDKKINAIIQWLTIANQKSTADYLLTLDKNYVIEYYKDNDMYMTYKPYDDPDDDRYMNFDVFVKLTEYTDTLWSVKPYPVEYDGGILSNPHYYGKEFFLVLSNGYLKDTSIRGSDGINAKGNPTKSDKDRKKHRTKFGTTAVKQSDLALNIFINPLYEEDKHLLNNNTAPLHDYLHVMGRELKFTEVKNSTEGDNSDD